MLDTVGIDKRGQSGMEKRGETGFWQPGALYAAKHDQVKRHGLTVILHDMDNPAYHGSSRRISRTSKDIPLGVIKAFDKLHDKATYVRNRRKFSRLIAV